MMRMRVGVGGFALALGAVAFLVARAPAQDYPQRAVTIIVPYPPGGATDLMTRILAEGLRERFKQSFVVENRPGAGTLIGAATLAKSAPDGYTLLLATSATLAISPYVFKSIPYDPVKDFAPVALVGTTDFVLVSHPSIPATTLSELIAFLKDKPGAMSYATAGIGTPHHLFMELFLKMAGLKLQHIPHRGSPAALTDVMSGQVAFMMCDFTPALPMIQEGKVKAFAVAAPARVAFAPDIPTIAESGLPSYAATGWFAIMARAGTPRPIIDALNDALTAHLKRPEVRERLARLGMRPLTSTPEELARHAAAEMVKWGQVARDAGISPE